MTVKVKPDRIWSIHDDHEVVLKQTWSVLLKSFGYGFEDRSFEQLEDLTGYATSKSPNALPKISSTSIVPDCPAPTKKTIETFHALNGNAFLLQGKFDTSANGPESEKYSHLEKFDMAILHQSLFSSLRNDHPDNNLLRFVRARKFKLGPIIDMAAHCMEWKTTSHCVDKWTSEGDSTIAFSKKHPELIKAFEMKKVYLRGKDKDGGPICVIRVKKHFGSDCPEKDFEIFICLIIEWCRLALNDFTLGNDGANILFDMSGFSLKNADLNAVKFLAKAFEANYPESLSAIWIHKAPWIFNAVWKIIKGWLDPVVASKIHFTKSSSDLEEFVDIKNIPKDLGGLDDYDPEYVVPTPQNSARKAKDEKYEKLIAHREQLSLTFLQTTIAWIEAKTQEESTKWLNAKIQLGGELAQNYIELDPYIRERGYFDRNGAISKLGF